ncbi:Crp/Fnr family transcriptional regulator [Falsiroseomonas sp. CW058]|uniref:Crp/Fnr family transcriptional regulator n=1 Tax=Falsiroseomonas sp. CW058 TaxID=3388664 RepID=UPI003D31BBCC
MPHTSPGFRPDPAALAAAPLLAGLDPPALHDVAAAGHTTRLAKDATLFEQGAPATALHLVLHGRLKVLQTTSEGQQTVLRFAGPNEPAGVLALLGPGQAYPATVVAVVDSVLLSWEGAALRGVVERHPAIMANAMRAMSGRTQDVHARLREIGTERVERRLAMTLLRLMRQAGVREPDGTVRIDFPLARQDLAEMVGTTLPTASRILSAWEAQGILAEAGRRQVLVRDPHALVRIAEG